MLKILIVSESAERLGELARVTSTSGNYLPMRLQDAASKLPSHGTQMRSADVLVLDQASGDSSHLRALESVRQQYPGLPCILVSDDRPPDLLIRALRAGVSDVLGWPLDRAQLAEALQRLEANRVAAARNEARVISLVSGKGGAGASFLAGNLGYVLSALEHKRVLLIDLNLQFGDTHFLVTDKVPPATLADVCAQIDRLDDAFFEACLIHVSPSFDILAGASDPVKAGDIRKDRVEYVLSLAAASYDFVLIDAGQDINPVSVAALDLSDQILLVTQPGIAYARTGRRMLEVLEGLHYGPEKLLLLVNRQGKADGLRRDTLEGIFGTKTLLTLPDDPAAVDDAISHGVPAVQQQKRSAIAKALTALGHNLVVERGSAPSASGERVSALGRFFLRSKTSAPNTA
ncbi:pilus assembly protein CpaE [Cupriavidus sp. USMAA2-4]|uniref:AAA family ATPase n=1 Tax=Cupriavidus sp. USMAA2-4 TaxID=876364 RepID=UPI0008A70F0A|nr:AAA family ATPase [Cupriavidus sp. USMAA2-4]AOY91441.1 pilus assembly protein CpaE [Cupriavidus sp. USMAA2-4]